MRVRTWLYGLQGRMDRLTAQEFGAALHETMISIPHGCFGLYEYTGYLSSGY